MLVTDAVFHEMIDEVSSSDLYEQTEDPEIAPFDLTDIDTLEQMVVIRKVCMQKILEDIPPVEVVIKRLVRYEVLLSHLAIVTTQALDHGGLKPFDKVLDSGVTGG